MGSEQRQHFRLHIQPGDGPKLVFGTASYDLSEISEKGIRVVITSADNWTKGKKIVGTIRFKSGDAVHVSGEVLRIAATYAIVRLDEGIPLSQMMAEHRRLMSQGKSWV